jgi:hypothetical protein
MSAMPATCVGSIEAGFLHRRESLREAPGEFVTRAGGAILSALQVSGGMAEWLKAHAWKACIRETVSWVRIPLPPPALCARLRADVQNVRIKSHHSSHKPVAHVRHRVP